MPFCKNCGKEFEKIILRNGTEKIYCCEKCGKSANLKRKRQKLRLIKYCNICNVNIIIRGKICSKCRYDYNKQKAKEYFRKKFGKPHPLIKCKNCGDEFIQKTKLHTYCGKCYYNGECKCCGNEFKTKHLNQIFCSRFCRSKYLKPKTLTSEEKRLKKKIHCENSRKNLTDKYVKELIFGKNERIIDLTNEIIEQRRISVKIKRTIKQLKQLSK